MMNMGELMWHMGEIARAEFNGHYTILHFTTNVRVGFRTPGDRMDYYVVPAFPNLREALIHAIKEKPTFY